jgi:adenosylcobinamide-GDP ribazoletransferase
VRIAHRGAMAVTWRAAAAGVGFLTRVPIGRWLVLGADDVARGTLFFPLVGAGIGALVGVVATGLDGQLTATLAAAAAVVLEVLLTGAIHLDGLADAADGLGGRTRERVLEIMREPAVGAFGVTAIVVDLLVKTAAIAAIAGGSEPVLVLAVVFGLSRAAPVVLGLALPYARPSGGTGLVLTSGAAVSAASGLAIALGGAVGLLGVRGLWLLAGAAVGVILVGALARVRLGGVTGDVLGAAVETATLLALVAAAASR